MQVKNWFRFDLHSHTSNDKKNPNRKINIEEVYKKYKKNNVNLIAITDHNIISEEQVNEYNELAKKDGNKNFLALNGSELDIFYSDECYEGNKCNEENKCCLKNRFQVLSIVDKSNIKLLKTFINKHYIDEGKRINYSSKPTITDLLEFAKLSHSILIPHFNKQGKQGLKFEHLTEKHKNEWDEIINIFHLLEGNESSFDDEILKEFKKRSLEGLKPKLVKFSDQRKTSGFDTAIKHLPIGIFELSYDGLLRAVHSSGMIIERNEKEKLPECNLVIQEIIHNGNVIKINAGVTSIIGEMGSGKSVLLDSLLYSIGKIDKDSSNRKKKDRKVFIDKQKINFRITGADNINSTNPMIVDKVICLAQNELKKLINEIENNPDSLLSKDDKERFEELRKKINFDSEIGAIHSRIKRINLNFNSLLSYLNALNDWINKNKKNKKNKETNKILDNLSATFKNNIEEFRNKYTIDKIFIDNGYFNLLIDILKIKNKEYFIDKNKNKKISSKIDNLFLELKANFLEEIVFSSNKKIIIKIENENNKVMKLLKQKKYPNLSKQKILERDEYEKAIFDSISSSGNSMKDINILLNNLEEKIRTHNGKESSTFNPQHNLEGIIKIEIKKTKNSINLNDVLKGYFRNFNVLKSLFPNDLWNLEKKDKTSKYSSFTEWNAIINGKPIKKMSPGERQSTLIKEIFKKEKVDLIVLDQPEDDLDAKTVSNSFVEPLIKNKSQKQLIIVTHDPKIVVNADSSTIIIAKKDIQGNISYSESKLMGNKKNNTIAEIIDGQKSYIHKRSIIYREDRKKEN